MVIYIGKAAMLRNRVRQYFQPRVRRQPRLRAAARAASSPTSRRWSPSNEKEALLLENTLIKQHQPRFNVNLQATTRTTWCCASTRRREWPRLEVVRRLGHDGARYFGPYHSATSCRETLRVVNRHFQLRTCTDHVLTTARRPCLQYQIKRCPAPCVLPVPREEYGEQVRDVALFLEGKNDELLDRLRARMKDARGAHRVRAWRPRSAIRCARSRRRWRSSAWCRPTSSIRTCSASTARAIALEIVVLSIRGGKLLGSRAFSFKGQEFPDAELLVVVRRPLLRPGRVGARRGAAAVRDRGRRAQGRVADREAAAARRAQRKVEVLVPQRGDRRQLVELAHKNAAASFATRRNAARTPSWRSASCRSG